MTDDTDDRDQNRDLDQTADGDFTLYDLRVECVEMTGEDIAVCDVGDYFEVRGGEIRFPDGQGFSMYALASLLPLLPAKQRRTHSNDWMSTDMEVSGPDPNVGAIFQIERIGERTFEHDDVSGVDLDEVDEP